MCFRYSAAGDLSELTKFIEFNSHALFFAPRYNIAPRQQAPVIILENFRPILKLMRWGLIPPWAKDEKIGDNLIIAPAETISDKISFRKPLLSQRCLIPADGFFEWQRKGKNFTPFRFFMRDNSIFCFAGIYEKWFRPPKLGEFIIDDDPEIPPCSQIIETFSIITTEANEMVTAVHGRMPLILDQGRYLWWLDARNNELNSLKFIFRPYPAEEMDCYRVTKLVNNAQNDLPACILPG